MLKTAPRLQGQDRFEVDRRKTSKEAIDEALFHQGTKMERKELKCTESWGERLREW